MRKLFTRALLGGLILYGVQAFAWQVTLQPGKKDAADQVKVSSDRDLSQVDVYLVWLDLDAQDKQPMFLSWTWGFGKEGWQEGILPVSQSPLDIQQFDITAIGSLDQECPKDHRCFLALVATEPGQDPTLDKDWQAASLLPLTLDAGRERLPYQQFFLPPQSEVSRNGEEGDSGPDYAMSEDKEAEAPASGAEEAPVAAGPAAESATAAKDNAGSAPSTEKPDIFRLVGNQLLYANGQANRFQVIDLSDVNKPRLVGWTTLSGSPRELYVMGSYYILLQTDYTSVETGTHLTVLSQGSDGKLTTVQDKTLSGTFSESRRRGDFIYTVTQDYVTLDTPDCMGCTSNVVKVNALHLNPSNGMLEDTDSVQVGGYSPRIAIFPDHLTVANDDPSDWISTQIAIFDLAKTEGKLVALPLLKVPGRVPSEFHMDVANQQFRVVYGPEDRQKGSTLAVYDLLSPKLDLLGQVGDIAPGEDLFATRFVNDRAFIVTYERKDPLWVIDLSQPTKPTVLGELIVPGWSEKLFFHDNRLFAVGIDDQPAEGESKDMWVRRVAMSLFDVADPTKPALLSKFTPLTNRVTYSWSLALDEERALLLDWDDAFAALPIEAWDANGGSFLQIVSLMGNQIQDAGLVDSPVSLQRSLSLAPDTLATLGDQMLLTVRWGMGTKPQVLGELELASNLIWLIQKEGDLWASSWGNKGYHRLYRYSPSNLETPTQNWSIPKGYGSLQMDGNLAVFYDSYSPLAVQVLDVSTGQVYPPQMLEKVAEETPPVPMPAVAEASATETTDTGATSEGSEGVTEEASIAYPVWYDRSLPLVHDGWFYVGEQQPFDPKASTQTAHLVVPKSDTWETQWTLRSWYIKADPATEAPRRLIPGRPLGITATGELITQESTNDGNLRLNLLALSDNEARLLSSRQLPCRDYSEVRWANQESLYIKCETQDRYWGPVYYAAEDMAVPPATDAGTTSTEETPAATQPEEQTTQILKLSPARELADDGQWTFKGVWNIQAISKDVVLLSPGYSWYGPMYEGDAMVKSEAVASDKMAIMPPYQDSGCDVYQLQPASQATLLKHLETCPYGSTDGTVLTSSKIWTAEGFTGIKEVSW